MTSPPDWTRRQWLFAAAQTAAAASASTADPCFWSLCQAALEIRRRRITSEELTRLSLERIKLRNPRLNAFITLTADRAIGEARRLDADLRQGKLRGPLHGVPIALKDNIDTAGVRTTAATRIFDDRVPTEDAEVARRVSGAGAVLLGKLNLDEFAFEGTGTTSAFGPVRNPWNLDHIAGGSSAGSAAALADGLCFASVGSDDGGSVRIPGSHCGIVGFKPSYGRVSTRGIVPSVYSLDCAGPMTRTVEDAALVLGILAGNDPLDSITLDRPVPDYSRALHASCAALRAGIPRTYFFDRLNPETASAVEAAIDVMRPRLKSTTDVVLPQFQFVEGGSYDIELYHYHRPLLEKFADRYHPWSRRQLEAAANVRADRYVETLKRLREARRDIRRTFENVDILLLPTMREPAPAIEGIVSQTHRRLPSNVAAFNRFGLPAITVPCGFSRSGLPIGLQIVGPSFGESAVLTAAYTYQQATRFHAERPA